MPGKTSTEMTLHFETHEDMLEWLEFVEFHRKRLRCPPQEVIGRLVAEWKKSGAKIDESGVEVLEIPKPAPKTRKKKGDDSGAAGKILAEGPR
jgi:hypothetical protein